ncbi:hypothetical protein IAQ61_000764 [Plenodomus lingam]|uniref:uncharacterized protein n=1 Tax=Leptosphaeria maculans TaxID=5022 RepID=UPI00332938FC|nr:hypothetical protein IAQ61_000764 [Plenodomus lingam]
MYCSSSNSERPRLKSLQPAAPSLRCDVQIPSQSITTATTSPGPILELTMQRTKQPYGFGPAAASQELPFPAHANLTAAEILTFLPHSIGNADILYRLVSNGGTRRVFSAIINTQRLLLLQWSLNNCGTTMYKAMNDAGYVGWTVGNHDFWHNSKKATWREENLNVAGCRQPGEINGSRTLAPDVPFRNLAMDVRQMPQGHDALDLTRMVQHCVQKSEKAWMYPSDYSALLDHLGGPTAVTPQHYDREVFKRWADVELPAANPTLALQGGQTRKIMRSAVVRDESPFLEAHKEKLPRAPASPSRQAIQTSKRRLSNSAKLRGKSKKRFEKGRDVDGDTDMDKGTMKNKAYLRPTARHILPPKKEIEPLPCAIELAFRAEGMVDEPDAFSPYAFGGPRSAPPYRSLHQMNQPDGRDISGWAENLRWASEQRSSFWQSAQVGAWNESPKHMELIAKIRQENTWASEELLEHLAENHDKTR